MHRGILPEHLLCLVPTEARRGQQMPWNYSRRWLECTIWVLGTDPRCFGSAASALSCHATSSLQPPNSTLDLNHQQTKSWCCCEVVCSHKDGHSPWSMSSFSRAFLFRDKAFHEGSRQVCLGMKGISDQSSYIMPYVSILIVHYLLFSSVIVVLGPHLCCYVCMSSFLSSAALSFFVRTCGSSPGMEVHSHLLPAWDCTESFC